MHLNLSLDEPHRPYHEAQMMPHNFVGQATDVQVVYNVLLYILIDNLLSINIYLVCLCNSPNTVIHYPGHVLSWNAYFCFSTAANHQRKQANHFYCQEVVLNLVWDKMYRMVGAFVKKKSIKIKKKKKSFATFSNLVSLIRKEFWLNSWTGSNEAIHAYLIEHSWERKSF